jgi:hypothetical protein
LKSGLEQVFSGQLGIFAGPYQYSRGVGQSDSGFGKFDGGQAKGNGAAIDVGLGAYGLSDAKGVVKEAVKKELAHSAFEGEGIGGFDLGENLVFSNHLGVEAGGNFKEVANDVRAFALAAVAAPDVGGIGMMAGDNVAQKGLYVEGFFGVKVELNTVAGIEDDGFANAILGVHTSEEGALLPGGESQPFAHVHGAVVISYAVQDKLHTYRSL